MLQSTIISLHSVFSVFSTCRVFWVCCPHICSLKPCAPFYICCICFSDLIYWFVFWLTTWSVIPFKYSLCISLQRQLQKGKGGYGSSLYYRSCPVADYCLIECSDNSYTCTLSPSFGTECKTILFFLFFKMNDGHFCLNKEFEKKKQLPNYSEKLIR